MPSMEIQGGERLIFKSLIGQSLYRLETGWHNQGYIFPDGFKSRVNFRSSVELDQLCVHECSVLGSDGEFWPLPTFKVVAMDRPEVPLIAKSCTGCWTGVSFSGQLTVQASLNYGSLPVNLV